MSESAPAPPQIQAPARRSVLAAIALCLAVCSWLSGIGSTVFLQLGLQGVLEDFTEGLTAFLAVCAMLLAIAAIICGIIALLRISLSRRTLRGGSMASGGFLLALACFCFMPYTVPGLSTPTPRMRNESSAVSSMRDISVAQVIYQKAAYRDVNGDGVGDYGTLAQLADPAPGVPGLIDPFLATGTKRGYNFTLVSVDGTADVPPSYTCTATPIQQERTGFRAFFVDESGVIRFTADGSTPTAVSPPLD